MEPEKKMIVDLTIPVAWMIPVELESAQKHALLIIQRAVFLSFAIVRFPCPARASPVSDPNRVGVCKSWYKMDISKKKRKNPGKIENNPGKRSEQRETRKRQGQKEKVHDCPLNMTGATSRKLK